MFEKAACALNYQFKNEKLLCEALTHASSADHRLSSNERMEFLGDAILGFVVCEYLFRNYPELLEGEMTKIKSAVVSRKICAQISSDLDLVSMLTLGKGMSGKSGLPSSITAAVLEAIIAAMYLDGGIEPVRTFILKHLIPHIDEAARSAHQHNFKSVLQHYAQKRMPSHPMYVMLDEKGPDHSKCFEVCVEIDGRRFSSTWANSKKEAEQQAALIALTELGIAIKDDRGRVLIRVNATDNGASSGLNSDVVEG
ncbi:MAG: ribonuclease III [Phycisphaeraceae bacterium]|nr:ribonuclease III [Phycisphaeraceae bacterium]